MRRGSNDYRRTEHGLSADIVRCAGHGELEVFGVGEDFVLVGVLLLLDGAFDGDGKHQRIQGNGNNGQHALGHRVDQRGADGGVHEAVRIQHRNGGKDAGILEQGEYLCKHTPQRQRVGPVLDPAAFVPQCCSKGRCQKQCQTTVPGMGRQIQIGILEIFFL